MKNSGNTKPLGDAGEDAARALYAQKGFSLVERNFRTRFGEVDIIVQKGDLLVFAEVKA
ncbi:MAG: YraN family protein, partial [Treponema sp.]|nr:YraN family protein [Treponema sp.]